MSLDVHEMVRTGYMEHDECILCATCIDVCPKDAIAMPFLKG
jgi:NAD-dependent dihydropyrimidine dehydrogenase PreA subunit